MNRDPVTGDSANVSVAETILADLLANPERFSFDAAIDILRRFVDNRPEDIHFHVATSLVTPTNDIIAVSRRDDGGFDVTTGFGGLIGADGTLPRAYTALAIEEHRKRSPALTRFLDLLAQRPTAQFADAGTKYRIPPDTLTTGPDAFETAIAQALLSLTGYPPDNRTGIPAEQILYFSGLLQARPRSAERLRAILSEWLCTPVTIEPFQGQWADIETSEQTALPSGLGSGQHAQLGETAIIGSRQWDTGDRLAITIGPLFLTEFEALCPPAPRMMAVSALIRSYLDDDTSCSLRLVLKKDEVPTACLGTASLGRTTWVATTGPRSVDADDFCIEIRNLTVV